MEAVTAQTTESMAALVVDAAHIRAPFPSPDDDPALRRPAGSRPEELVAPSAEDSPVLSGDKQDSHYTRQEPVPSQVRVRFR